MDVEQGDHLHSRFYISSETMGRIKLISEVMIILKKNTVLN
jgi:hypothetical protein